MVIPDLVFILSTDGFITNPNPAWEKVLGYSGKELLNVPYVAFLHPDDLPLTVTAIEKAFSGSHPVEFINRMRDKDGKYRWFHWMIRITAPSNEVFVYAKDITRQREAELSLEKKERTLNALREKGSFILLSLDLTGVISLEDSKFRKFLGYIEEEISGQPFEDFVAVEDKSKLRNFYLQVKHGENKPLEILLIHKEGINKPVFINGFVVYGPDGSAGVLNLVIHDLSGQHKALDVLKKSEKKLRTILEAMKDAVLVLDKEGKIIFSNSGFTGMWGIPGEMLGIGEEENLLGFVVRRLQELKIIHKKVNELGQKGYEEQDYIEFNDGRIFEIQVISLVSENVITGRLVLMRDRTEDVKMKNKITASERTFRSLTELSNEMVFFAKEDVIVYANPRAESLSGFSRGEFCRMNLKEMEVVAPECKYLVEEKLRLVRAGHPVEPFEFVLIRRDGERITTILFIAELTVGNEKLTAFFISDINYYKQSEMLAARKMESVERYHKLMVGRELKMIELKKEVNKLLVLSGESEKYTIVE